MKHSYENTRMHKPTHHLNKAPHFAAFLSHSWNQTPLQPIELLNSENHSRSTAADGGTHAGIHYMETEVPPQTNSCRDEEAVYERLQEFRLTACGIHPSVGGSSSSSAEQPPSVLSGFIKRRHSWHFVQKASVYSSALTAKTVCIVVRMKMFFSGDFAFQQDPGLRLDRLSVGIVTGHAEASWDSLIQKDVQLVVFVLISQSLKLH